jgi:hypothetical protein
MMGPMLFSKTGVTSQKTSFFFLCEWQFLENWNINSTSTHLTALEVSSECHKNKLGPPQRAQYRGRRGGAGQHPEELRSGAAISPGYFYALVTASQGGKITDKRRGWGLV